MIVIARQRNDADHNRPAHPALPAYPACPEVVAACQRNDADLSRFEIRHLTIDLKHGSLELTPPSVDATRRIRASGHAQATYDRFCKEA